MFRNILYFFGYKTFYFVSYIQSHGSYGSMTLTVRPYIDKQNYKDAIKEIYACAGNTNIAILSITKL